MFVALDSCSEQSGLRARLSWNMYIDLFQASLDQEYLVYIDL